MPLFNIRPQAADGSTAPAFSGLVAGKDGSGNIQDIITDTDGHLQVDILSGGGSSASVFVDNAAFTLASSSVTVGGGVRDDTLSSLSAVEGDAVPLRVSSTGALHVTGAGGGTEYSEDAVSPSPIVGTATLMERDDVLSSLTPVAGDFAASRCSAEGALWTQDFNSDAILADTTSIKTAVEILDNAISGSEMQVDVVTMPSTAVTNAGTFAVQVDGNALTALQLIDNIVVVDDAAFTLGSGSGVMMMGFAGTQSVNANDSAALACDTDGALHIADGGNSITIDGTVTANLSATDNAVLDNIQTAVELIDNAISGSEMQVDLVSANVTNAGTFAVQVSDTSFAVADGNALGEGVLVQGDDGSDRKNIHVDASTGDVQVDVTNTVTVDLGSNNDVTVTSTDSDGLEIQGGLDHDAADAGSPVKVGMKAIASKADPTEVAANDRTDWYASVAGVPWVIGGHPNVLNASINVTDADGAQANTAIITVAGNLSIVVTHIAVTADNANTADVQCRIGFGTSSTPAADAAGIVLDHPGIAKGGGMVVGTGAGIIGQGASNEDLRVTCEDPAGGSISINVSYYVIAI